MIVLDASILIAHFDSQDGHHDKAHQLLTAAQGSQLAASPITLAEVLVTPARAGRLAQSEDALRALEVDCIPLPHDAPTRLATLRAATMLKLPDCCVVLAAEQTHARVATFDDRLLAAAHKRGLAVVELS